MVNYQKAVAYGVIGVKICTLYSDVSTVLIISYGRWFVFWRHTEAEIDR